MPESMLTNWLFGCTIMALGIVLLMEINPVSVVFRKRSRGGHVRGLTNRVAMFNCPDCGRPICLLGASHAVVNAISRNDPQWDEIDPSFLTPRQRVAPQALWIHVHCLHCDQDLCFDDIGQTTSPPKSHQEAQV